MVGYNAPIDNIPCPVVDFTHIHPKIVTKKTRFMLDNIYRCTPMEKQVVSGVQVHGPQGDFMWYTIYAETG